MPAPAPAPAGPLLLRLPDELLVHVLARLSAADLARVAAAASRFSLRPPVSPAIRARGAASGGQRLVEAAAELAATAEPMASAWPMRRNAGESWLELLWLRERGPRHFKGRLAAGSGLSAVLDRTGVLWSCGRAGNGQLGHGETHDNGFEEEHLVLAPAVVDRANRPIRYRQVQAGAHHAVALERESGQAYSWGLGVDNCLGHPDSKGVTIPRPQLVVGLAGVRCVQVAASQSHTLVVTAAGELWSWGEGTCGQLGHPTCTRAPAPLRVGSFGGGGASEGTAFPCATTAFFMYLRQWLSVSFVCLSVCLCPSRRAVPGGGGRDKHGADGGAGRLRRPLDVRPGLPRAGDRLHPGDAQTPAGQDGRRLAAGGGVGGGGGGGHGGHDS
eukprot:SAG22_NODE_252_length_13679_cov_74.486524_2_plen_386_part_00